MREIELTLGGRELRLAANYKASMEIAKKVGDPLTIRREAMLEAMLISENIPYEPKWRFTIENTVTLLEIGTRYSGQKITRAELEELVFDAGFGEAKEAAAQYLQLIFGPTPEESVDTEGKPAGN